MKLEDNHKLQSYLGNCSKVQNLLGNILGNKLNTYERDWSKLSKFDRENFILDYFSVDWDDLWKIDELNADKSNKPMHLLNQLINTN